MKKRDLKNAYGKAPMEFHNTVIRTLNSLETTKETTHGEYENEALELSDGAQLLEIRPRKRRLLRTVAACALIVAVGTVSVVSAKAIYPMVASREGNYGLNIELEPGVGSRVETGDQSLGKSDEIKLSLDASKNAPEYVRLDVGYLPEGVIEDQGKYSLNGEHKEKCFSFACDRVIEKKTFTDVNIFDYEELEINGNKAILANASDDISSRRFYIYFDDMATFVTCYVTSDVSKEEIIKVMENVSVDACTEEEANIDSLKQYKEALAEEKSQELIDNIYGLFEHEDVYDYSVIELGQKITYCEEHESVGLELTIDNIEVLDSISGLDYNCFEPYVAEDYLPIFTDENGNFIPHEREHFIEGDGINTPGMKLSKTDWVTAKLVYVTLTVNNPTNTMKQFVFQGFETNLLSIQNGKIAAINFTDENGEYTTPILCGEARYIDNNNVGRDGVKHGYNFLDIDANTTQTIHIGFLADEDELDDTYLTIDECWCAHEVFDPKKSEFVENGKDYYHNVPCIKVE